MFKKLEEIINLYEQNKYSNPNLEYKTKKETLDGKEIYTLDLPVKESKSELVNKFIRDMSTIFEYAETKEGIFKHDSGTFNNFKQSYLDLVLELNTFEELYEIAILAPLFSRAGNRRAAEKALNKEFFQKIRKRFEELKANQSDTVEASTPSFETSTEQVGINQNEAVQETKKAKSVQAQKQVKDESAPMNELPNGNQSSGLSLLKSVNLKGNKKQRELTHRQKNFQIENEIYDALERLRKELGIKDIELVNVALRIFIGEAYPEYAELLKPIEDMNYSLIK